MLIVLMSMAQLAMARDMLLLTGAEIGSEASNSYGFAGAIVPLGGELGNGWHGRLWLDSIRYAYETGGGTVKASAPGGHLAAGYQSSYQFGSWALFGGFSYRDTKLNPDQPGAANRGSLSSVLLSGELSQVSAGGIRFSEEAVVEFEPESWWTRLKMSLPQASSGIRHGLYGVALGGPEYEIFKLGYSADGFKLGGGLSGNLGAGFGTNPGVENFAFLTLELVWLKR